MDTAASREALYALPGLTWAQVDALLAYRERVEGAFLVLCLVLFTAYSVHLGRREVRGAERAEFAESAEDRSLHPGRLERLTAAAVTWRGHSLSC